MERFHVPSTRASTPRRTVHTADMGRTRSGAAYERASSPPRIAEMSNCFSQTVLSPPLLLQPRAAPSADPDDAHRQPDLRWAEPPSWSTLITGSKAPSRRLLEVITESLSGGGSGDLTTNGAARAACFLARLATLSRSLKDLAGKNDIWRPLLAMSFGSEYWAQQASCALPKKDAFLCMQLYGAYARELQSLPSLFFRSLLVQRDGVVVRTYDIDADQRGELPYRAPTLAERARVALWAARVTLLDESIMELPDATLLRSSHSNASILQLLDEVKPMYRSTTFESTDGSPFFTVDGLLHAVRAVLTLSLACLYPAQPGTRHHPLARAGCADPRIRAQRRSAAEQPTRCVPQRALADQHWNRCRALDRAGRASRRVHGRMEGL